MKRFTLVSRPNTLTLREVCGARVLRGGTIPHLESLSIQSGVTAEASARLGSAERITAAASVTASDSLALGATSRLSVSSGVGFSHSLD